MKKTVLWRQRIRKHCLISILWVSRFVKASVEVVLLLTLRAWAVRRRGMGELMHTSRRLVLSVTLTRQERECGIVDWALPERLDGFL